MEGFNLNTDSILTEDEISSLLFEDNDENEEEVDDTTDSEDKDKDKEEDDNTTEVDADSLFDDNNDDDEKPESVGSDKDKEGEKEDTTNTKDGSSRNFFSSIANAFVEEGIFPDLDEEEVKGIKTPADLREAVNKQIQAGLTEQQQRIDKALNGGVEAQQIRYFENVINELNVLEKHIEDEGADGENARARLIYQDYVNRGFTPDRAAKEVKRSFDNGDDINDAKEALDSNKDFITKAYNNVIEEGQRKAKQIEDQKKEDAKRAHDLITNGKLDLFNDVEISKSVRQKAIDSISKPIYKDPSTGDILTAIQKLSNDDPVAFTAKLGVLYALTDGFTNLGGLVDKKVKKEMKKGFASLESKLNNTSRDSFGNLRFTSGVADDESFIGKGIKLDL